LIANGLKHFAISSPCLCRRKGSKPAITHLASDSASREMLINS
jgi:hypothetical protein